MAIPELMPGDCLVYFNRRSVFNWLIALRTWNFDAHVEVYAGGGMSFASRDGLGVNAYGVRMDGLVAAMRPVPELGKLDWDAGKAWFSSVRGQSYGWIDLLAFVFPWWKRRNKTGMVCSPFATRLYRKLGLRVFNPDYDADRIAPAQFRQSAAFETVYHRGRS